MTGGGVDIRRFAPGETAAYRAVRLEALGDAPRAFSESLAAAVAAGDRVFARQLAEGAIWGAFQQGRCVGMVGLDQWEDPNIRHKATIWGLYVSAAVRGRRVGEGLLTAIIAFARREGVTVLQLGVGADNPPARRLYDRMGFEAYGVEKRALRVNGRYVDEVLMALML